MFSSNFIAILLRKLPHDQVGVTLGGKPWSAFADHRLRRAQLTGGLTPAAAGAGEEAAPVEEGWPGRDAGGR